MPTYFGLQAEGACDGTEAAYWYRNKAYVTGFTCPGSGTQVVKEISSYAKSAGGTPAHVRLAIYSAAYALLGQGVAEVTVNNTTPGWYGHLTQADITPNPCNLTGGVQYYLGNTHDGTDYHWKVNTPGGSDAATANSVDYTGGWPDPLPNAYDTSYVPSIRCGVDAAPAGYTDCPFIQNLPPYQERYEVVGY